MNIKLQSLRMTNFKCHKHLKLDFGGKNVSIYGDNATGKTSIYDALTWLLFGKDSAGNGEKNIEIKPLNSDGSVMDHQAVTEVEAVFLVDGEEVALMRTYQEAWSTKRGSSEPTYDGNTSEYYVCGVPCKANAYKAKVAELVDEDRFRLLTTVSYFPATLSWQKRRETLFSLFGAMTDQQIMETDGRFTPLLEAMGKLPLEDYKKAVTQKRKGFSATRNEVPARISECEKTISDLASLDFDGADMKLSILNRRAESLNAELLAIENNTAVMNEDIHLKNAELKLRKLESDNQQFRSAQNQPRANVAELEASKNRLGARLSSVKRSLDMKQKDIEYCDVMVKKCRDDWKLCKAEAFKANDVCPCCGQKLPDGMIEKARQDFERDKLQKLDEIVKDSERYKQDKVLAEKDAADYEKFISEIRAEVAEIDARIWDADSSKTAQPADMEGYAEKKQALQEEIDEIRKNLRQLKDNASAAASGLRDRIYEVQSEIRRVSAIAGKRSAYDYALSRIEQLREEARAAADNLNELDRILFLMEEFIRYKAGFVEDGINGRFRLAKFRLFREQANGGVEDRCDVVYDGVPYICLNNAAKINVGIDIINTLSRAYGVTVPLFVDNAESVTNLEKTGCQVIRLVVSENDKELRIDED